MVVKRRRFGLLERRTQDRSASSQRVSLLGLLKRREGDAGLKRPELLEKIYPRVADISGDICE